MYKQLNRQQRYEISAFLRAGLNRSEIARQLEVSPSTISREIARNSTEKRKSYNPETAQEYADIRKERVRRNRRICESIKRKSLRLLEEKQWSPKQISGYLSLQGEKVSHESIYRWIREDKTNGGSLYKHCRHKLKRRSRPVGKVSNIPDRVSIHQRPQEADGKRLGDLEMDLIVGRGGRGAILTVTDRMTNMIWAAKLKDKSAQEMNRKLWALLVPYKAVIKTIVTDNGSEFSGHRQITDRLGVPVFFSDPYSSWQKGAIENANKLLRQYIPKMANFDLISQKQINEYCAKINARPREKLNFKSPVQVFFSLLP